MNYVYVLDKDKHPLMPTTRYGKVRRMLKDGRAVVAGSKPFTIRLTYKPKTNVAQDICVGIDPGRTNIGISAVREDRQCLYMAYVGTKNKQIPKHMSDCAEHRRASRRGERKRRQRRARENGTDFFTFVETPMGRRPEGKMHKGHFIPTWQRRLPGYNDNGAVTLYGLKNSESRFNNRVRPEGWLTPTAEQLLRTHTSAVRMVEKILPVSDVCIELNKFAFMAMDDPDMWKHRLDFQNGPLKGYSGVNDAVDEMQNDRCLLCGDPIECHHHVLSRHKGGSDTIANIVGLCNECHTKVHTDEKAEEKLNAMHDKRNKKYGALSVLNQIIPYLLKELKAKFPDHVAVTTGYETMLTRDALGLNKDHDVDAYCIALQSYALDLAQTTMMDERFPEVYEIQQFRRHDRAIVHSQRERTYRYEGQIVAKNRRKRMEQKEPSLEDWFDINAERYGKNVAERMRSKVVAAKSGRSYNNPSRVMPGAVFYYDGKRYALSGQYSNGRYYRAVGYGNASFPSCRCTVARQNTGLVYV